MLCLCFCVYFVEFVGEMLIGYLIVYWMYLVSGEFVNGKLCLIEIVEWVGYMLEKVFVCVFYCWLGMVLCCYVCNVWDLYDFV